MKTRNESHGPDNRTLTRSLFGLRPLLAAIQLVSCNQSLEFYFERLPVCSAAIPPVKFVYSTDSSPTLRINKLSSF